MEELIAIDAIFNAVSYWKMKLGILVMLACEIFIKSSTFCARVAENIALAKLKYNLRHNEKTRNNPSMNFC